MKLRVIPEYEPVSRLFICFVQEFYNSRFKYGKALAKIIEAALPYVKVELFISENEIEIFQIELQNSGVNIDDIQLNFDSPNRSILNEWTPIFCIDDNGKKYGLTFNWLRNHPDYKELSHLEFFSSRFVKYIGMEEHHLDFDFSTSAISANEDTILVSKHYFNNENDTNIVHLRNILMQDKVFLVPSLAEELTHDLDTYLFAIKPKVWILSDYPEDSPQGKSVSFAKNILKELGHIIHMVPGLERICYGDINTFPSYTNSIILNNAVLVPSYDRKEDKYIQGILSDYGFDVYPIDSRDIVLTNSVLHCISKTLPLYKPGL
jgi:agmatine/peptidylarginine deiminase